MPLLPSFLAILGQTFETHDLILVGLLVVLEGVLSIDNALVLGLLARRLPKDLQGRALTYGLIGAFVFRLIAIATASYLLHWRIVKLLGGGYLLYVALKHFFFEGGGDADRKVVVGDDGQPALADASGSPLPTPTPPPATKASYGRAFWQTVIVIELTDIAFAVDSIVAAIGVVGSPPPELPADARHPKLWVVLAGGMLGVILMRFAAVLFIKLLEKFPRFETSAYLLVVVIGLKLVIDWFFSAAEHTQIDFHHPSSPAFWIFWILMVACFVIGFIPKKQAVPPAV